MDINNSVLAGVISGIISTIFYSLIKLCQHRHFLCASGCCRCVVDDSKNPTKDEG